MTDEYLITMLRNNVGVSEAACRAAKAAADRIEQLVAERDITTAAAYEVAAREVECGCGAGPCQDMANCAAKDASAIRDLATADQQSALDKLIAEAVKPYVEALDAALAWHDKDKHTAGKMTFERSSAFAKVRATLAAAKAVQQKE